MDADVFRNFDENEYLNTEIANPSFNILACIAFNLPRVDTRPPTTQMTRQSPTDPDPSATPEGEMKIPDPENMSNEIYIHLDYFICNN